MIDSGGKTILLTGASSGIGAATAAVLGDAGASLVAHYAGDLAGVEQATAAIEPDRKILLHADFTEPGTARRLWRDAMAWHGRIDVLVNNAAIMPETPIDSDDAEWDAGRLDPAGERGRAGQPHEGGGPPFPGRRRRHHHLDVELGRRAGFSSGHPATDGLCVHEGGHKGHDPAAPPRPCQGGCARLCDRPRHRQHSPIPDFSAATRGGEDAVRAILPLGEMVPPGGSGQFCWLSPPAGCAATSQGPRST